MLQHLHENFNFQVSTNNSVALQSWHDLIMLRTVGSFGTCLWRCEKVFPVLHCILPLRILLWFRDYGQSGDRDEELVLSVRYTHTHTHTHTHIYICTGCNRRNGPDFGRVFLMLNYTEKPQNTYIQSWTIWEIMASEVWNFDGCYTLTDYQIRIETGRNMWFL